MFTSNIKQNAPSRENTCAIVVSYNPESSIFEKILHLLDQVSRVVVIDNGSSKPDRDPLIKVTQQSDRIHLILNEENIGQAKALNIGIKYAQEHKYCWLLTMDQDSLVAPDMLLNMSLAYQECDLPDRIVSICPVLASYDGIAPPSEDNIRFRSFSRAKIEGLYSVTKLVITSGNLLSVDIFDEIGLFEEDFFIDYVDQEFSLRLFQSNYKAIQANKAVLYHNLGNTTQHSLFGKQLLVTNNNSLRTYYFYRNGIVVYKKYFFRDFSWVIQDFIKGFIFNLVKIILFESERKDKLAKVFIGLAHGFTGRMGKYNSSI
jgi:rhamnosyltransferase